MNRIRRFVKLLAATALVLMLAAPAMPQDKSTKAAKPGASVTTVSSPVSTPASVSPMAANNKTGGPPAPPAKGGPKTRGENRHVLVAHNHQWAMDVYLNKTQIATVGPWVDVSFWCEPGSILYSQAVFQDGSTIKWGPQVVPMGDGVYTWTLTP